MSNITGKTVLNGFVKALATAEDVTGSIKSLASDKSNDLTSETIKINGGQFML